MARVPEAELERLKREVSVRRLAEAKGVTFKKSGDDNFLGRCPFHDDKTPSLVVSEKKNVWHCLGACRAGGGPIDFVMKAEGVTFRHAVELLREGVALAGPVGPKHATVPKLPCPLDAGATDAQLLAQVRDYYHQQLKASPEALAYLESRGLRHGALIEHFRLGFANRTLGLRLPDANREAGAKLRGRLQRLGVWRESGHEHLNGSLVVPLHSETGEVVGLYGRKVTAGLRAGTPAHLYLPGPHRAAFNSVSLVNAGGTAIVCEAILDALSFWAAGYRNVISAYGVDGFTAVHLDALVRHQVRRVLIAFDRDDAGDAAAAALARQLEAEGLDCFRVAFPRGLDANEYSLKVQPAAKSLGVALRHAAFMGAGVPRGTPDFSSLAAPPPADVRASSDAVPGALEGERRAASAVALRLATASSPTASVPGLCAAPAAPLVESAMASAPPAETINQPARAAPPSVMVDTASRVGTPASTEATPIAGAIPPRLVADSPPVTASPTAASPSAGSSTTASSALTTAPRESATPTTATDDEALFAFGPRRYRVRGLGKQHPPDSLRLNLLLSHATAFHVDTFDLYSAKARLAFVLAAAAECGLDADTVKRDVGQLLLQLEVLLDKRREDAKGPKVPVLSEEERDAALALLRTPDLLERILEDFGRCGVVGEETNKLVGYLAAVSRKLEEPLAILIQSSSAAGKSSLMEAVLAFVPEEEKTKFSAMTGQSLFYMGDISLSHKVLAVVEEEGASRASYALKLLQSEGELTIASTGKDPHSGRLVTHEYRVEGPTQLFLTTTATDIDEELLNRCLVLSVDEDRAQTSAIHARQRHKRTLEGRLEKREKDATLKLHQNAQRLLRPLAVVNPFARQLTFPDAVTRARRDFPKYLTLIEAIALLHQYQRPVKTAPWRGGVVEYVEVTPEDISTANRLASAVLGRSLDELPPQTRRLQAQLEAWVTQRATADGVARAEVRFTRREVREALKWGDTQLKVHLGRLLELELLASTRTVHGGFAYSLRATEAASPLTLATLDAGTTAKRSALEGGGRGAVGPRSAPTPPAVSAEKPSRLLALAASAPGGRPQREGTFRPSEAVVVVATGGDVP